MTNGGGMAEPVFTELPSWLLSQAALRSHRVLHRRLGEHGATGHDYRVLRVLGSGARTQAELGRATFLDRSDINHAVIRLAGDGYVTRAHSEVDARAMVVSLTAAGRRRARMLSQVVQGTQEEILEELNVGERELLVTLLARIAGPQT